MSYGIRAPESGPGAMRPENALLTRFSYLLFPALPAYFSHGSLDPILENRLLRRGTRELLVGNTEQLEAGQGNAFTVVAQGEMTSVAPAPHSYGMSPNLTLAAGGRYALIFDFLHPQLVGALVLHPEDFSGSFYTLPEFGGPLSFGSAPGHSHLLPVSSTLDHPESFSLEFRSPLEAPVMDLSHYARFRLLRYESSRLPINVTSLMPYRALVTSPEEAWLETPRMYQDAYQAIVNARRVAVAKSPQGLVMIPVPAGQSVVKLQYYPPPILAAAFWISLISLLAAAGALLRVLWAELPGAASAPAGGI